MLEKPHRFRHAVTMAYVELHEVADIVGGRLVRPAPGLVRFRRRDYLGRADGPLLEEVRRAVADRLGHVEVAAVGLLTNLRTLGHCFNPVSFYYCFDRERSLVAVVADVTNTPWGERHHYVLAGPLADGALRATAVKALHVSPFMDMAQRYECRFTPPGPDLRVDFATFQQSGSPALEARLDLRRSPLTNRSLTRYALRASASSRRTLVLIYLHAAWLRLKGVRTREHP